MTAVKYRDAIRRSQSCRSSRSYPDDRDPRSRNGNLFPVFFPAHPIRFDAGTTVFTIGSCFARNIEEELEPTGVRLPTRRFSAPPGEWEGPRANGMLNEYNPGCMSQRILAALDGRSLPMSTIVPSGSKAADLLLSPCPVVAFQRAIERRGEIDAIYARLRDADLVVITLGMVEAWYDQESGVYLNRLPPHDLALKSPERFVFRQLDVDETCALLEPAIGALGDLSIATLLTVSPVPLGLTFTGQDCVAANEVSKAVLRLAADRITRRYPHAEYFPSFEIVRSGGLASYGWDHTHVKEEVVASVTAYLLQCYRAASASVAGSRLRNS